MASPPVIAGQAQHTAACIDTHYGEPAGRRSAVTAHCHIYQRAAHYYGEPADVTAQAQHTEAHESASPCMSLFIDLSWTSNLRKSVADCTSPLRPERRSRSQPSIAAGALRFCPRVYRSVCVCPSLPVIRQIIWACEFQYVQDPTAPVDRPCVEPFPTDARSEGIICVRENQILLA